MKKLVVIVLALLLCVGVLVACGKTEDDGKKVLKLGFDAEYPPYGYLDAATNTYVGFDIELARAVCEELGWKLELVPIDWNAKDMALESGDINCIWSGFTINGRENDYEWTQPYSDSSIVVMVKNSRGITKLSDLAGKVVSVQADSSGESTLKKEEFRELVASFKDGKFVTCKDYTAAFTDLETEAIDALVIDVGVAGGLMRDGYSILSETLASEQYGIGFKKGDTATRDAVDAALTKIAKNSTTVADLAAKYGISDSIILGK